MKRFLAAAGGAAVLAVGALSVTYAQTAPTTPAPASTQSAAKQQREAILADAAAKLGLSTDQLQQALTQARKDIGVNQTKPHPLAKIRNEELQVAAKAIGLTNVKALRTELAGSTLTAVAQKHNVQPSTVSSVIQADLTAKIQAAVTAGTIKADRQAALDQKVQTKVVALMTHEFPAAKSS